MISNKKVLVLGSGGREYAFAWKLLQDPEVGEVFCAPGNGGTDRICNNLNLDVDDHEKVLKVIRKYNIDLTLVGPEVPLANGIVDYLESHNVRVFGPDQYASQLESSKLFARDIMQDYNIPQPRYKKCNSKNEVELLKKSWGLPLVVKADGLAAELDWDPPAGNDQWLSYNNGMVGNALGGDDALDFQVAVRLTFLCYNF